MEDGSFTTSPYLPSARRFIGYALRSDARELYYVMNAPAPGDLARRTTLHLTTQGLREGAFNADRMIQREDRVILTNGINDTLGIIQTAFEQRRPSEESEALAVIRQPETILTIAKLALRDENALTNLIDRHGLFTDWDENFYRTAHDLTHIESHPKLATPESGGCPMAGRQGEVAPDPLFKKFVPWAGELAVRSLYAHKYKKDR